MRNIKQRKLTGVRDPQPRPYEALHAAIAREAAAEGIVLLENRDHILPLAKGSRLAAFGAGVAKTIKGGTGSGDVNERYSVTIAQGLRDAGFILTNEDWLADFESRYQQSRLEWKNAIIRDAVDNHVEKFFDAYARHQYVMPVGSPVCPTDTDMAIFSVARIAGEAADRFAVKGDYYLTDAEEQMMSDICTLYRKVIVIINAGGVMDLSFMDKYPNIKALLIVSQPGMEGGHAVADVLCGAVSPSGKLTDSWACRYEDYPNSKTFSHNNSNVEKERYEEGIYVGYRYFDSFGIPVRYSFGYGKTYSTFDIHTESVASEGRQITVSVTVRNTGDYAGKEVVQVYASMPDGALEKEAHRLAAFAKTSCLEPGASEALTLRFDAERLASYLEADASWILEKGACVLSVGNSLQNAVPAAALVLEETKVLTKVCNICPLRELLRELSVGEQKRREHSEKLAADALTVPNFRWDLSGVPTRIVDYTLPEIRDEAATLTDTLSQEQLISLVIGDPGKGQNSTVGSAGISVPGSAGETSTCALEQGIANIVLADGPAGLRLNSEYYVVDGMAQKVDFIRSIEHGFFADGDARQGEKYYQYCTAIPVGTMLAQTWNMPLLEKVGAMIGEEMKEFGVQLWLAPGMNIHRNPLCGRNFEYFSEDPIVSGFCAAAITRGVQSHPGIGTTIKHFACNNQEDNRKFSDSILSERTLREIYLRGFEIAIGESAPRAIMTSYNLINGVHAANCYDICTRAARCEFGFKGMIMTDWTTTNDSEACTAAGCMRAGNDLVMPGQQMDLDDLRAELASGKLPMAELKRCVTRLIRTILISDCCE